MKIFPNITTSSPIFRYMTAVYSTIAHKEKIDNFPGMDFTSSKSSYKLKKENIITNLNNLFKYCINPIAYKFGTSICL